MAKKNRPKKSKALVVWAIVTVIVLLADCVGNYLVVGLPGNMNSLLDKPMAAIGKAIDFKLSAGVKPPMPNPAGAVFLWYNQDDKFEKLSEWDTTIQDTMEE